MNIDPEMAEELFKHLRRRRRGGAGRRPRRPVRRRRGGRPAARARGGRPEPVEAEVTVPFDVAANGGSVAIEVGGRRIDVKVPAGIEEGKKLRVPADGDRLRAT